MKFRSLRPLVAIVVLGLSASAATPRNWQEGTLLESEQTKVLESTTRTSNTDGVAKTTDDNDTRYSQNTTTNTTQNYDTYQIYTVDAGSKIYTASEQLLFPWSKPANVTVGEKMKFAVEKNTTYILDDDGKHHKARIKKVQMKHGSSGSQ
jgi:uncharacterized protein YpuA (DUF1002 family)